VKDECSVQCTIKWIKRTKMNKVIRNENKEIQTENMIKAAVRNNKLIQQTYILEVTVVIFNPENKGLI